MMNPNIESLLAQFSSATELDSLLPAADALAKGKFVNTVRNDPRFVQGIECCFRMSGPPSATLMGIAIAYRLGAASKPAMSIVRSLSSRVLSTSLPPLSLLANAKDRYYVALALSDANGEWLNPYIARSIAEDDSAELARRALAHSLFAKLSLSEGLRLIADWLREVRFDTEKPAESAAKRLRRVVAAIRPSVIGRPISPGSALGSSLRALFESASRWGKPTSEEKVWRELTSECCHLVSDILRTQLTVLADPEIYRSLQPAKIWIDPRLWPRYLQKNVAAQAVCSALQDAIVLLAKQGVTDQRLLETLEFLVGTREGAVRIAAELAGSNPGIKPEVRDWLMRFGRERSSPALESFSTASEGDIDGYVASLLLSIRWIQKHRSIHKSGIEEMANDLIDRDLNRLRLDVEQLARIRKLTVRLEQGDVVEYSPLAHELLGGHRLGVRRVRVEQPLVERVGLDGVPAVVQKAIVEAIKG